MNQMIKNQRHRLSRTTLHTNEYIINYMLISNLLGLSAISDLLGLPSPKRSSYGGAARHYRGDSGPNWAWTFG